MYSVDAERTHLGISRKFAVRNIGSALLGRPKLNADLLYAKSDRRKRDKNLDYVTRISIAI